jgi:hypothetical protein
MTLHTLAALSAIVVLAVYTRRAMCGTVIDSPQKQVPGQTKYQPASKSAKHPGRRSPPLVAIVTLVVILVVILVVNLVVIVTLITS